MVPDCFKCTTGVHLPQFGEGNIHLGVVYRSLRNIVVLKGTLNFGNNLGSIGLDSHDSRNNDFVLKTRYSTPVM